MQPFLLAATALLASGAVGLAASAAPQPAGGDAAKHVLACEGAFAKDLTKAKLVAAFGAANVTDGELPGAEGQTIKGTIVFAKKPADRVEIMWKDEDPRHGVDLVRVADRSTWSGPKGLHVGSSLADVEKANGKPFKLGGFGWDYGGFAMDWQGGALQSLPGGCTLLIRFDTSPDAPEKAVTAVSGEKTLVSSAPAVRAAKPVITELSLRY